MGVVSPIGSKIDFWGPYFWISCMIFRYYPEINFYTNFWSQNSRKQIPWYHKKSFSKAEILSRSDCRVALGIGPDAGNRRDRNRDPDIGHPDISKKSPKLKKISWFYKRCLAFPENMKNIIKFEKTLQIILTKVNLFILNIFIFFLFLTIFIFNH